MGRTGKEQKIRRISRYWKLAPFVRTGNERGIALLLALVMLVILGILGTWALDTTSTELKIVGNFRTEQYAFFAADAGIGYVTNANVLTAVYNYNNGQPGWGTNIHGAYPNGIQVDVSTNSTFTAGVPSLLSGPLPPNGSRASIYDADVGGSGWHGIYTAVTSTGSAVNNATVVAEAVVAQAVPNH
ncbi:MAG TPA: PilX N-terminal domain-containing pilus assembly protein [Nitrospirota bacterium]|nr:PilX N-terminal domain-containing pilus assembly protein [Nitrospirota bacterium]